MAQFISIETWSRTEIINLDQVSRFYILNNNVYVELTTTTGHQRYDGLSLEPQCILLREFNTFEEADSFLRKVYENLKGFGLVPSL